MCGVGFVAGSSCGGRRAVLPRGLGALERLAHRGAVDADGRTGDGAGVLTEIPWKLLGIEQRTTTAVGFVFLPRDREKAACARRLLATSLAAHGLTLDHWRPVPIDESVLGPKAKRSRPDLFHAIVTRRAWVKEDEFERRLDEARKETEQRAHDYALDDFTIASLSHRTIVYKALVRAVDLAAFFADLRDPQFETAFVLFHQRFSTNTSPSWPLTQPFRFLAHNGEINTVSGNRNSMRAQGTPLAEGGSDSASLDEAFSFGGRNAASCCELLETWEGPALVVFSDGRTVGAALDRNGLRPARYVKTTGGALMLASEAGVFDVDEEEIAERGRIAPGGSIEFDLESGKVAPSPGASRHPLPAARGERLRPAGEGLRPGSESLRPGGLRKPSPRLRGEGPRSGDEGRLLRAFGYTHDELQLILGPMFDKGAEPIGSMGDDTPLAILSSRPRLLFSYFKQRFAQVTNPPIDPLRESLVMSLDPDPLLDRVSGFELSLLFTKSMTGAVDRLLARAVTAARNGMTTLVLTDRGIDATHAAIPSLLAVSAVHQRLMREGLRMQTRIVADTGEARDDHHIASLLAFGADAVCPWLALDLAAEDGDRYVQAIRKGLLKILSKMGVSSLRSYRGAQLFEAVGIGDAVIERYFTGTPSLIGGIGIGEIEQETRARHAAAFTGEAAALEDAGNFRYRQNGEVHAFEPRVVKALHNAIATGTPIDYRTYAGLVHAREPVVLRDLMEIRVSSRASARDPLRSCDGDSSPSTRLGMTRDEVEPATSVVRRFMTAAMSLGALSIEAQEVLAEGMNRLDARSNSGEGGEAAEAFGTIRSHRIKQVASARFGVTAAYLNAADEIQIKMAQGSKPGEGGQLPGHKVTPFIARVRHASPGTTLISPPPHHDIYSIEDLAQLIYDLKRVNPSATVSVKLVSSAGIGAIAVGVAKAYADAIEISGHDGGTGASPLGSIKNAGAPWEIGLAEAHRALVAAGLRERVRLQVNGGLKTGRDVVIAALLGAEEFAFGTAALVAAGCVMARQCHLNTCPVGIATQREDLRAKFKGTPENVIRFFMAVAEEVRQILALLGARTLAEIIGHSDYLEPRLPRSGKASTLRFDRVLAPAMAAHCTHARNDPPQTGSGIDEAILNRVHFAAPIPVTNADRSIGARIAGAAKRVDLTFRGSAGQSFGAFCVDGMRLVLDGEANDGVAKGMSGGEIVVRNRNPRDVIAGNAILYGATGGRLFISGRVGERFAVRNSGAFAVVEGTGDHACEYMTAGAVIILGPTGVNVGAGMSGGLLFTLDDDGTLAERINAESVIVDNEIRDWLRDAIALHAAATHSTHAAALVSSWAETRQRLRRIVPRDRVASHIEDRKIARSVRRGKDRARLVHERLHVAVSR